MAEIYIALYNKPSHLCDSLPNFTWELLRSNFSFLYVRRWICKRSMEYIQVGVSLKKLSDLPLLISNKLWHKNIKVLLKSIVWFHIWSIKTVEASLLLLCFHMWWISETVPYISYCDWIFMSLLVLGHGYITHILFLNQRAS